MALQKKNEFVQSHLIVFVTWYFVLFLFGEHVTWRMIYQHWIIMAVIATGGIAFAATFAIARRNFLTKDDVAVLGEVETRGLNCSIGQLPSPRRFVSAKPNLEVLENTRWWAGYSKKYPLHGTIIKAALAAMQTKPNLPASPVPGGHGGATLIRHSLNTVDVMIEMMPKWEYVGQKNGKGEIIYPLRNIAAGPVRFAQDDPLPILAAFVHDIGKVVCYEEKNGSVIEKLPNHDTEGARLLRRIPEVLALPWRQMSALLLACEYYHKPMAMPEADWIDDYARSLMELLIVVDNETGRREEGRPVEMATGETPEEEEDVDTHEEMEPAREPVTESSVKQSSPLPAAADTGAQPSAYDLTYSVLLEGGRINGNNTIKRIGWKHEEWVYINDAKLRAAVAERTGDPGYMDLPRGNMNPFTYELLEYLSANGWLLQDFEGRHYSHKRAVFTTVSTVKKPIETRFVIVAKTDAFPFLKGVPDCKEPPKIIKCSWGASAAINKKQQADPEMPDEGEDALDLVLAALRDGRLSAKRTQVDGTECDAIEIDVMREILPEVSPESLTGRPGFVNIEGKSGKRYVGIPVYISDPAAPE